MDNDVNSRIDGLTASEAITAGEATAASEAIAASEATAASEAITASEAIAASEATAASEAITAGEATAASEDTTAGAPPSTLKEYRAGLAAAFSGVFCLALVRLLSAFGFFGLFGDTALSELVISLIWPTLGGAVVPFVVYFALARGGQLKHRFKPEYIKKSLLGFGYGKPSIVIVFFSLLLGMVYAVANLGIATVTQNIMMIFGLKFQYYPEPTGLPYFLVSVLTGAIMPALYEEFTSRALLLKSLTKKSQGFAITISALVFALFHMFIAQTFYTFCMGIITAFLTIKLRNIWPAVIIHFVNNFGGILISFLHSNGLAGGGIVDFYYRLAEVMPLAILFIWASAIGGSVLIVYGMIRYNRFSIEYKRHRRRMREFEQRKADLAEFNITTVDERSVERTAGKPLYTVRRCDDIFLWATVCMAGMATLFSLIWAAM